jgi:hypothetical protein
MKIITGDSWAVGEWNQDCRMSGPVFGQLLMLHDVVVNLSVGAASNHLALDRLEHFLDRYHIGQDDCVLWVLTYPSRDLDCDFFVTAESTIMQRVLGHLDQLFTRSDEIARRNGTQIQIIGGLCDLVDINMAQYSNLEVIVPSWGRLLDPGYNVHLMKCDYWIEVGRNIINTRPDLFAEWENISNHFLAKQRSWDDMRNHFFSTDGHHPDRHAHRLLRDHLWPEWAHKF